MKRIWINLLFILFSVNGFAQSIKVAILDFENTSGKTEYDALGKAMSSMLITDLGDNIHPKKVEFFERSQLNKLLDEQNLQRSKNFDAKTAVDFGKLSGVNYVFVGSVFVMDGNCALAHFESEELGSRHPPQNQPQLPSILPLSVQFSVQQSAAAACRRHTS